MSLAFDWHLPVNLRFGVGCSDHVAAALAGRDAVVLAFEPAGRIGLRARWEAELGSRLRGWVTVPEGLSSIAAARALSQQVWPVLAQGTVLVAVGGGTTLDLAKVLRCQPADGRFDGLAAALRGASPWPPQSLAPLWLIPTTAGTGSEVTPWATVWDTDAQPARKLSLDEPWGHAERAFVDPSLALSCPPNLTRDTALDALAHALEALWNRHANAVSNRLAVAAARSITEVLPLLLRQAGDLGLRTRMSLAALQAGMAFSQTRTALAHALSYDLTLHQAIPHGLACAMWLPTAWRLALGRDATADTALAEVFACPADHGPLRLQAWLSQLGIDTTPAAFAALGITDAPQRIEAALGSARGRNFIGAE